MTKPRRDTWSLRSQWLGLGMLLLGVAITAILTSSIVSIDLWPSTADRTEAGSPLLDASEPDLDVGENIADPFAALEPGRTTGEEAVSLLRDEGYLVFDYFACSDVVRRGRLLVVRETFSGQTIVDSSGVTRPEQQPQVLDVLIGTGGRCS